MQHYSTNEKVGYSDADWANSLDNWHSTTGNIIIFIMSGAADSWLSQNQATVALSIAEAEYNELGSATQNMYNLVTSVA